jgi:hypothetical protein
MYCSSTTAGCASNTKFFPTSKPSASQFRMTLRPESSTHPSFPHILHWWECLSGDDPSVVGAPSSSLLRSKICVGATIIQNGRTNVLPDNSHPLPRSSPYAGLHRPQNGLTALHVLGVNKFRLPVLYSISPVPLAGLHTTSLSCSSSSPSRHEARHQHPPVGRRQGQSLYPQNQHQRRLLDRRSRFWRCLPPPSPSQSRIQLQDF